VCIYVPLWYIHNVQGKCNFQSCGNVWSSDVLWRYHFGKVVFLHKFLNGKRVIPKRTQVID